VDFKKELKEIVEDIFGSRAYGYETFEDDTIACVRLRSEILTQDWERLYGEVSSLVTMNMVDSEKGFVLRFVKNQDSMLEIAKRLLATADKNKMNMIQSFNEATKEELKRNYAERVKQYEAEPFAKVDNVVILNELPTEFYIGDKVEYVGANSKEKSLEGVIGTVIAYDVDNSCVVSFKRDGEVKVFTVKTEYLSPAWINCN